MMIYKHSLATAGNFTTSATPATEVEAFSLKAGVRNAYMKEIQLQGKAAALTAISGIAVRCIKWGTASTGGTGTSAVPADPGYQAMKATAVTLPSSGSTRTNRFITGCSGGGPGGWVAPDQESYEVLEGGGALGISLLDVSGTASMVFEASFSHRE